MLVKCPRCGNLLEAEAGLVSTCRECGFQARAPAPPAPGVATATAPAPPPPSPEPRQFLGPLAFLAGLAGLATFYLARFFFPLVFSLLGIIAGIVAYQKGGKDMRGLAAAILGGAGLVLALVVLLV